MLQQIIFSLFNEILKQVEALHVRVDFVDGKIGQHTNDLRRVVWISENILHIGLDDGAHLLLVVGILINRVQYWHSLREISFLKANWLRIVR